MEILGLLPAPSNVGRVNSYNDRVDGINMGKEAKRVLLLGDYGHADFREAVDWISQHTVLSLASTVAEAAERLLLAPSIDVAIIAQSEPDQFTSGDVERLHVASPLTRLVALLGSWCEGEMRTGRPWPGVLRIYWHQWQARMTPELMAAERSASSVWQLPRTATVDERLAATVEHLPVEQSSKGMVAIHCRSAAMYQGLRDACRLGGYASVWFPPNHAPQASGAVAAIWDGISGEDCRVERLRDVVHLHSGAPVMVLLDFVRRQDRAVARAAGAAAILAKPVLVADLLWQLDSAVAARRPGVDQRDAA